MADKLTWLFGFVCGQLPAHTWTPGGVALPLCQRCTGLYTGAAVALLLHAGLRLRPSDRILLLHGGFLLLMVPLGYHWVPQTAVIRTLSGILFGAGVTCLLWLNPGPRLGATRLADRDAWLVYAATLTSALVVIPAAAIDGGSASWHALAIVATLGFAGLALLAAGNIVLGAIWLARRPMAHIRAGFTPAPGGIPSAPAVPPGHQGPRGASHRR